MRGESGNKKDDKRNEIIWYMWNREERNKTIMSSTLNTYLL